MKCQNLERRTGRFAELLAAKQIKRMPRLFAAQPRNCSPIDASFKAGVDEFVPREIKPTIAEGTAIRDPVRLPEILAAIRRSHGDTIAVPEENIVDATRELARLGLYAEPTSATAAAALHLLQERGSIRPDETTVVLLTGSGLKATTFMAELFKTSTTYQ